MGYANPGLSVGEANRQAQIGRGTIGGVPVQLTEEVQHRRHVPGLSDNEFPEDPYFVRTYFYGKDDRLPEGSKRTGHKSASGSPVILIPLSVAKTLEAPAGFESETKLLFGRIDSAVSRSESLAAARALDVEPG